MHRRLGGELHDAICDRRYEISTKRGEVGVLTSCAPRPSAPAPSRGLCHEVLWSRPAPCTNCPFIPSPSPAAWRARSAVIGAGTDASYVLVVGRRIGLDTVRVEQHTVTGDLLGQLLESRLEVAASVASLSPREREVLRLLMLGRSLKEIGTALEISPRTAKYHQANVLTKLGADSRLDILRLLAHEG